MNEKPNIPGEVVPGRNYSLWTDAKVNGWLIVAALTTYAGDWWLGHHKDCPVWLRVAVALIPLPSCLLWMRKMAQWIRGMDELQRRITTETVLFAVSWTLVILTFWQRLSHAGTLEAIFQQTNWVGKVARCFPEQIGLSSYFYLTVALLGLFFFLGHAIFNRRYQ